MDDTFDRRLIDRIASGEEEALSELFRRHAQVLYNYAARVLGSAEEAEHAVSGVFLSVWSGVPPWPRPSPPEGLVLAARLRESLLAGTGGTVKRPWRDVDLWSIVSARGADTPTVEAACAAIRKCGALNAAVLSIIYFGGRTIAEAAEELSMFESECRSRLQACLSRLAGDGEGERTSAPHGGKFLVNAAVRAVGAGALVGESGYDRHIADGCPGCSAEIERYSAAAHSLPGLLPEVRLPADLHDKILFSVRLAGVAASRRPGMVNGGVAAAQAPVGAGGPAAGAERRGGAGPARRSSRAGRSLALAATVIAIAALALLGSTVRELSGKLEQESDIVESLQDRTTELLLKYDRLAGISEFFESKGVVTVLRGTPEYPGLAGKILWDTTAKSALLQVINPPEDLQRGRIRVSAVGGDATVKIAEFQGDDGGRDSGGVFYRFFPFEAGHTIVAGAFAVDVRPGSDESGGEYRGVLEGAVAGRQ